MSYVTELAESGELETGDVAGYVDPDGDSGDDDSGGGDDEGAIDGDESGGDDEYGGGGDDEESEDGEDGGDGEEKEENSDNSETGVKQVSMAGGQPQGGGDRGGKKSKIWQRGQPITVEVIEKVWKVAVKHPNTADMCKGANAVVNQAIDTALNAATGGMGTVALKVINYCSFATNTIGTKDDTIGFLLVKIKNSPICGPIFRAVLGQVLNLGIVVFMLAPILEIIVPIMDKQNKQK
jgi:hypothetical protein